MKTTIIAVILGCVLTFVLSAPAITHGDTITVNANATANTLVSYAVDASTGVVTA